MSRGRKPTLRDPEEWSTIAVKVKTREKLRPIGVFGENFDALIDRVAEFYLNNHKMDSGKPGESATQLIGGETSGREHTSQDDNKVMA
jgi:hypothetical protein